MKEAAVVIPNWNGMKYIGKCLDSLRAQSCSCFQVYVIDNGSTDGSRDLVEEFYPEVSLHCFSENTGFCRAVNEGIRVSSEPYVILLNNDTAADPHMVEELLRAIRRRPKAFSCQAKMLSMAHPDLVDDAGDAYCALGWAYAMGRGKPAGKIRRDRRIFASCGGAAIYRRSVLDEIGLFDERHFAYLEDIDIGYRAALFGYGSYLASKAVVLHAGSGASGSKYNAFKVRHSARNSVYLVRKNMPLLQRLLNLPFLMAGFGIKMIFFFRKGHGKDYVSALQKGLTIPVGEQKVRFSFSRLPHYVRVQLALWKYIILRFGEKA